MNVDIVCVGFGPAMGGFLTTLARGLTRRTARRWRRARRRPACRRRSSATNARTTSASASRAWSRRRRSIRASFPAARSGADPHGRAGEARARRLPPRSDRRQPAIVGAAVGRRVDPRLPMGAAVRAPRAVNLPWVPPFLRKHDGLVLSMGQFMQWVGAQVMSSGTIQVWPSTPVASPLLEGGRVVGVRLIDQGDDQTGSAGRTASCRAWTSAPPLPWSVTAPWARSASSSTSASACPRATISMIGPSA